VNLLAGGPVKEQTIMTVDTLQPVGPRTTPLEGFTRDDT